MGHRCGDCYHWFRWRVHVKPFFSYSFEFYPLDPVSFRVCPFSFLSIILSFFLSLVGNRNRLPACRMSSRQLKEYQQEEEEEEEHKEKSTTRLRRRKRAVEAAIIQFNLLTWERLVFDLTACLCQCLSVSWIWSMSNEYSSFDSMAFPWLLHHHNNNHHDFQPKVKRHQESRKTKQIREKESKDKVIQSSWWRSGSCGHSDDILCYSILRPISVSLSLSFFLSLSLTMSMLMSMCW